MNMGLNSPYLYFSLLLSLRLSLFIKLDEGFPIASPLLLLLFLLLPSSSSSMKLHDSIMTIYIRVQLTTLFMLQLLVHI